ncbi:MAG: toll/interleukin-1 receptor domain-containing protein [Melioribacteraceae bacterium]
MKNLINKPRVFLSHAKKDIEFMNKVYNDLIKCQIDPWIDSNDIRHGEPWLDAIFENGIPTCDSFIVYLTEYSVESKMVKKEIDASIIQKLNDNGISFLPYVENGEIRNKLRVDLQAIQTPIWNSENYDELLPRVISEIWRSYMERKISNAINSEKVKSLEYQLELERIRNQSTSVFSSSEDKDFQYIFNHFNVEKEITIDVYEDVTNSETKKVEKNTLYHKTFNALIVSLIPFLSSSSSYTFHDNLSEGVISSYFRKNNFFSEYNNTKHKITVIDYPKFSNKFLTFGLIERVPRTPSAHENSAFARFQSNFSLVFTDKMERFKYWLNYNNALPNGIELK